MLSLLDGQHLLDFIMITRMGEVKHTLPDQFNLHEDRNWSVMVTFIWKGSMGVQLVHNIYTQITRHRRRLKKEKHMRKKIINEKDE